MQRTDSKTKNTKKTEYAFFKTARLNNITIGCSKTGKPYLQLGLKDDNGSWINMPLFLSSTKSEELAAKQLELAGVLTPFDAIKGAAPTTPGERVRLDCDIEPATVRVGFVLDAYLKSRGETEPQPKLMFATKDDNGIPF